jgi:hypothetical protein
MTIRIRQGMQVKRNPKDFADVPMHTALRLRGTVVGTEIISGKRMYRVRWIGSNGCTVGCLYRPEELVEA